MLPPIDSPVAPRVRQFARLLSHICKWSRQFLKYSDVTPNDMVSQGHSSDDTYLDRPALKSINPPPISLYVRNMNFHNVSEYTVTIPTIIKAETVGPTGSHWELLH